MTDNLYTSRELFGWLWHGYLKRHTGMLLVAILFMTLEGSMLGALSWMMQPMFDQVFIGGNRGAMWWVGAAILGVFAVRATAGMAQKIILARIAQVSAAHLRNDMLARLMQQDGAFHLSHPPGFLIQRIQTDVDAIGGVWSAIITGAGRDFIALFVLTGVAVAVDPVWALLAMVGTPILILPATLVQRFVRASAREARDLGAQLATRLDEVFHGIVPVKLNALETYQAQRYKRLTDRFVSAQIRSVFGAAAMPAMVDIMAGLGFFCVLLYGGSEIISGDKTVGQFMTFFTAMGLAFDPLRRLGGISGTWQIAASAIERLRALMDSPIQLASPANPKAAPEGPSEIVLDDVKLAYGETEVLRGLTLNALPGQTTALVGASGAGKSTVFNLLTRLVDAKEGHVTIGGVPTKDMALEDLRDMFSVVTQEALLFDETLRENILLGRTDVSDERLRDVLDAAHVSDFVDKLPAGLDTEVGPRGSALSGGQRQRVVIARALLRDTPILLLDEATSALDAQSEQMVQDALDRLSEGRTTLVIAHRLSTIRDADKIVVMDRGRAVDQGTHEELLARGGIYADLYRLQFEDDKVVVDLGTSTALAAAPDTSAPARRGLLSRLRSLLR